MRNSEATTSSMMAILRLRDCIAAAPSQLAGSCPPLRLPQQERTPNSDNFDSKECLRDVEETDSVLWLRSRRHQVASRSWNEKGPLMERQRGVRIVFRENRLNDLTFLLNGSGGCQGCFRPQRMMHEFVRIQKCGAALKTNRFSSF